MPDFWEFPTVSMGLTAINSIYQARFNRYLHNRGIKDTSQQHVWAFLGDGEMGEPESLGAIGVAAREELDNLTFVINCNLQQLDGPVRGNGKIIQELESTFRGAGWNVIKVVWGREWDDLLARDVDGVLVNQMNSTPDGAVPDLLGRGRRLHPRALLRRRPAAAQDGRAHDRRADRASCRAAATTTARSTPRSTPRTKHVGQPTVILAHTIKGWTIDALEGKNATHQMKKLTKDDLKKFRDRLYLPISDTSEIDESERRAVLPPRRGLPRDRVHDRAPPPARRLAAQARVNRAKPLKLPGDEIYAELKQGSGKQAIATTMALVRLLRDLMKDPEIGQPHRADRARRVPHVRHGLDVPERQGLQPGRPALRVGRPQACCWPTRSPRRARCCTRASPRRARWRRRRPPARRTPRTAST